MLLFGLLLIVLGIVIMRNSSIPMEITIGLAVILMGIVCVRFANPVLSNFFLGMLFGLFIYFIAMVAKEEYELKKTKETV